MNRANRVYLIGLFGVLAIFVTVSLSNRYFPNKPAASAPTIAPTITATTTVPQPPVVTQNPTSPKPIVKFQLLVFTATWCTVCQEQKPIVADIEDTGVKVVRIDIDEHPDLAAKYNVTAVPTYILYRGNKDALVTHIASEVLKEINHDQ